MTGILDSPVPDVNRAAALEQIAEALRYQGVATFTGIADRDQALEFAAALLTINPHRDSDPDGATTIARRSGTVMQAELAGFTDRELHPHTEGSSLAKPPGLLVLVCLRPALAGGESVLVDGKLLHTAIGAEPDMLAALSAPDAAVFGRGGHTGAVFGSTSTGRIVLRLRLDNLVWFSSTVAPYVSRLRQLVDQHTVTRRLAAGEGFVLRNDRWLHGRTTFTGARTMVRILGEPLLALESPAGF